MRVSLRLQHVFTAAVELASELRHDRVGPLRLLAGVLAHESDKF